VKFCKFVLALLLLPALAATAHFAWLSIVYCLWQQELHWQGPFCIGLGFSTMASIYLALPRWNWLYVFGHETTHAIAVLMSGGRVSSFKVHSHGGSIESDTMSVWIALAPYILPFYPLVTGLLWLGLRLVWRDAVPWEWCFLIFWGGTWGFHLCYTFSLLKTEQPDFATQGRLFSLVFILLANTLLLTALLWLWRSPGQWRFAIHLLWHDTSSAYIFCAVKFQALYRLAF